MTIMRAQPGHRRKPVRDVAMKCRRNAPAGQSKTAAEKLEEEVQEFNKHIANPKERTRVIPSSPC
ncbi:protein of unknown function [Nitrospira japonica]|uniref:Uncharacterized protein n=1 Tax=Nitrospira japonica TaxID=1325564 RepID=A0A1W1I2Z6_9BACT|nr:protein of unknown function [Nitrospira japonica]